MHLRMSRAKRVGYDWAGLEAVKRLCTHDCGSHTLLAQVNDFLLVLDPNDALVLRIATVIWIKLVLQDVVQEGSMHDVERPVVLCAQTGVIDVYRKRVIAVPVDVLRQRLPPFLELSGKFVRIADGPAWIRDGPLCWSLVHCSQHDYV